MEDTKWICSVLANCFCPSVKVVSTSGPSAEYFDKPSPRQLPIAVLALYCTSISMMLTIIQYFAIDFPLHFKPISSLCHDKNVFLSIDITIGKHINYG